MVWAWIVPGTVQRLFQICLICYLMNLKDGTDERLSPPTTDKGFLRAPGVACGVPGGVSMTALPQKLYAFYRDGFRSMVLGRTLWKLIALKLFLMFANREAVRR